MVNFQIKKLLFLIATIAISLPFSASALEVSGPISSTYKYAWGENIGWLNFAAAYGNIIVSDSKLVGYIWSDEYGWINLAPTNSGQGVANNCSGQLSGYAWGERIGWINFSGAVIDSSGKFTGQAGESSSTAGRINFDCIGCEVRTDWRPCANRPACSNTIDDDGDGKIDYPEDPGCSSANDDSEDSSPGGGGGSAPLLSPPQVPASGGFRVLINNGAGNTDNSIVILNLFGGPDTARMAISNFSDFRDAGQEAYQTTKLWNICRGRAECPDGEYTVYIRFYTSWGTFSTVVLDSVTYKKSSTKIIEPEESHPVAPPPVSGENTPPGANGSGENPQQGANELGENPQLGNNPEQGSMPEGSSSENVLHQGTSTETKHQSNLFEFVAELFQKFYLAIKNIWDSIISFFISIFSYFK
jgi:hypothetical protein